MPGKVLIHEWTHDILLEALLLVDHVVWDAQGLGYSPRIINVVEGTASPFDRLRHASMTGEAALVPQLHRQPDDFMAVGAQHGRDGRGIDSSRHGHGDGLHRHALRLLAFSSWPDSLEGGRSRRRPRSPKANG